MRFRDRADAGRQLALRVSTHLTPEDMNHLIVLGLPRGGVPVAFELAKTMAAPLDVFPVRKLGVPGHPELAMGAIAGGGTRIFNRTIIEELGIPWTLVEEVAERERFELDRRERLYRGDRPQLDFRDRIIVLVDDGLATGATMEAAVAAVRARQPSRVIVAVPVGASESCDRLRRMADDVVCVETPEPFQAVGLWYLDFEQTTDAEVAGLLHRVAARDD